MSTSRTSIDRRPSTRAGRDVQPVFIVGAPRSGTTLLYRALALHPDVAWINNYHRRIPAARALAFLNRAAEALPRVRSRVWFGTAGDNAYRYAESRSPLDRWFPQPVEGEPLFRYRAVPERSTARTATAQQSRLRGDFASIAKFADARVVLSKRIGHNGRIPLLHAIFPEALFIDMHRDGRAVAASLLQVDWWDENPLWWYGGTPEKARAEGIDEVLLAATHWLKEVEAIADGLQCVPDAQVLHLGYEELVADPLNLLADVSRFMGLPAKSSWEAALADLQFPDKNSSWAGRLGDRAEEVSALQDVPLRNLGYLK